MKLTAVPGNPIILFLRPIKATTLNGGLKWCTDARTYSADEIWWKLRFIPPKWVCRQKCGDPLYIMELTVHFRYYRKNEVVLVLFGAAHAHWTDRVKLNRQVYSLQQQISAQLHPDRRPFGIIAQINLFSANNRGWPLPRGHGRQFY